MRRRNLAVSQLSRLLGPPQLPSQRILSHPPTFPCEANVMTMDLGDPEPGETVLVSGAAGATRASTCQPLAARAACACHFAEARSPSARLPADEGAARTPVRRVDAARRTPCAASLPASAWCSPCPSAARPSTARPSTARPSTTTSAASSPPASRWRSSQDCFMELPCRGGVRSERTDPRRPPPVRRARALRERRGPDTAIEAAGTRQR